MERVSIEEEADTTLRQKLKDPEYRGKFIYSMILFVSYIFMGVRNEQHSQAFLDLAQITGTSLEQASIFYTAMSIGGLVGTFSMGFLFDKLTRHRVLLLATTCMLNAMTTTALPWSTDYILTIFIFFTNAVFQVGFDTASNASIMSIWGLDAKTFMQLFHFSHSLGTIISPITVKPFLSHPSSKNATLCQQSIYYFLNQSNSTLPQTTNATEFFNYCEPPESRIQYAYLISGCLCLLSGIALAAQGCVSRNRTTATVPCDESHRNPRVLPAWLYVLTLAFLSAMIFFHLASIITVIGYIMPFFVKGLGWSKERVTKLSSVFWAGFAVSRLLGLFSIRYLCPSKILLISNSIVVLSLSGLWLSVIQESDWGVWSCMVLSAVGFAVIIPTGFIYLENDVMKVTGRVTSVIWLAGHAQGIMNPPLLGYLMQEVSFMWYIYLAVIEGFLCFLSFGLLELVVKIKVSKLDAKVATSHVEMNDVQMNFIEKKDESLKTL